MPVILTEPDHAAWLNTRNTDTHLLDPLVRPCNSDLLEMYPVSTAVNNPAHDGPELTDRT